MSKECKTARNTVVLAILILLTLLLTLQSCTSTTYLPCASYADSGISNSDREEIGCENCDEID